MQSCVTSTHRRRSVHLSTSQRCSARPPTAGDALNVWRRAAGIVEAYRERWDVTDPQRPLGPSVGLHPHQELDRRDADLRLHDLGIDVLELERRALLERVSHDRGLDID